MNTVKVHTIYEGRTCNILLSEQQKKELMRFQSIIGSQNLTLHADNRLLIKNLVGYISTPHLNLQILPKLMRDIKYSTEEKERVEAVKLLFRMLHYSEYMAIKEIPDPQHLNPMQGDILEIFITIFITRFEFLI